MNRLKKCYGKGRRAAEAVLASLVPKRLALKLKIPAVVVEFAANESAIDEFSIVNLDNFVLEFPVLKDSHIQPSSSSSRLHKWLVIPAAIAGVILSVWWIRTKL
jgi:hypothetical protein